MWPTWPTEGRKGAARPSRWTSWWLEGGCRYFYVFFHPCVNHPYFDGHPFILQLGMVYYICVMLVKQCRKPSPILALLGGIETYWNRIKHDKTMIKPRFYHKLPRLWRVPLVQKGVQQTLATVADIFSQPWGLVVWELTTRPVKRTKSYWKWP